MASVADLNAVVDEAVALIASSDWGGAKAKLLAAQAMLASIPDRRSGEAELKFDRRAIAELLASVRAEERSSARGGRGLQSAGISFGGSR